MGCDYLVMTQKKAAELGHSPGAMSHDILGHEKFILPSDVCKAVVALSKSSRLLPEKEYGDKKKVYQKSAALAYQWLTGEAQPLGDTGYNRKQRGLPPDIPVPEDEWLTRDLVFFCWGGFEQWRNGDQREKGVLCKICPANHGPTNFKRPG